MKVASKPSGEIWDNDLDFLINDAFSGSLKAIDYEKMVASVGPAYPSSDPTIASLYGKLENITRAKRIYRWWASLPKDYRKALGDPGCQDNWGYYTRRNVWPVGAAVTFGPFVGAAFSAADDRAKLIDACSRRSKPENAAYLAKVRSQVVKLVTDAHKSFSNARFISFAEWVE